MNTEPRKKAKNDFDKNFFMWMNNAVFGKTMENVQKDIKLLTTERARKYLLFQPKDHSINFFTENLLATEMRKTQTFMNKPVYLGLSKLDLSKTVIY